MLVEVRSTGTVTVWPPSTHPPGERITFDADAEPLKMAGPELAAGIGSIARSVVEHARVCSVSKNYVGKFLSR